MNAVQFHVYCNHTADEVRTTHCLTGEPIAPVERPGTTVRWSSETFGWVES
jgi:hypothetical protein